MRYKTPAALEMAAKAAARRSVLDTGRTMTGFYFHRLLCRIFSDPHHAFVLKGGQSMLARTVDARATKDIDLLCKERSLDVPSKSWRGLPLRTLAITCGSRLRPPTR